MEQNLPIDRILIVRLSAMGDIIHSLPAVAALRRAFPSATIDWALEDRWAELLAARSAINAGERSPARPLVDGIHIADTRAWRSSPLSARTWRGIRQISRRLRERNYSLTVDLQAAIRSAVLNRLSGAPRRIGFAKPREPGAQFFYTSAVKTRGAHVVEQAMELAEFITGVASPVEFPLPRDPAADAWCAEKLASLKATNVALINPGAGWGAKRWPTDRYAQVAKALVSESLSVLINCGPGEEALAETVVTESNGMASSVSCSLAQLIALTRRSRLFIGGDTGPVHLAAALGIPVLAIYGPTDPARNGPFAPSGAPTEDVVVLRSAESRTSHTRHATPETGLLKIGAEEVLDAAQKILRKNRATV